MNKKSLPALLFISLLLNTFLFGIVVSYHTMKPDHMPPPPRGGGQLEHFESAKTILSPESREIIDRALKEHSLKMHDDARALMQIRAKAKDILTATNLDAESLDELHKEMATYDGNMKHGISEIIYDIATELPPEERIKFFEHVLRGPPSGGPRNGPRGGGPPGHRR